MSTVDPRTAALGDEVLPAVAVLLGHGVPGPLTAALAQVGTTVESAEAAQVTWWPGKTITVRYRAVLHGSLSGRHQLVATSGAIPPGAMVVRSGATEVGVWLLPDDPSLPGLAPMLDPDAARRLLRDLGADAGPVRTRLRSYRPGRRAVVEIGDGRWRLFAKVVPPTESLAIHCSHRTLERDLPVPRSLGVSPHHGVIALEALPGRTLRSALDDPSQALPGPDSVDRLLAGVARSPTTTATASPFDRLSRLAPLLMAIAPEASRRIDRLAAQTETAPAATSIHGDFHEAQLLVDDEAVVGLIDLDTMGAGRPGDDPAGMIGHMAVRRLGSEHPERLDAFRRGLLAHWDRIHDPADLRRRVAAVVAGLATGPFRVQVAGWPEQVAARLALAERWLDRADRLDEKSLIAASAPPHHGTGD